MYLSVVTMKTQKEIIEQGYRAIVNSLGVVDAIRFIHYFSPGFGDYTKERRQWLQQKSIDDVFKDIEQFKTSDRERYREIID